MRFLSKRKYYVLVIIVASTWLMLIIAAPMLLNTSMKRTALFIYLSFSPLCHQLAERSFSLGGYPLAVCSRCFGIYCGLLLGFVIFPFIRGFNYKEVIDGRYLIIASFPMAVDVAFITLKVYPSNLWTRFSTGLIFGTLLAFFALPGFFQMFLIIFKKNLLKPINQEGCQ